MKRASVSWEDHRYLIRSIQKTKRGEALRESGQISYSCLRDLFRKKLVFHLEILACTACGLEMHLLLPMPKFLTSFSRDMGVGSLKTQKIVI